MGDLLTLPLEIRYLIYDEVLWTDSSHKTLDAATLVSLLQSHGQVAVEVERLTATAQRKAVLFSNPEHVTTLSQYPTLVDRISSLHNDVTGLMVCEVERLLDSILLWRAVKNLQFHTTATAILYTCRFKWMLEEQLPKLGEKLKLRSCLIRNLFLETQSDRLASPRDPFLDPTWVRDRSHVEVLEITNEKLQKLVGWAVKSAGDLEK